MSSTLVLPRSAKGFEVPHGRRISPTILRFGEVPPPPPPPLPVSRPVQPPPPPPPSPAEIRAKVLAEEIPRAVKEADERARSEEKARYEQLIAQELSALRAHHQKQLEEEMRKRDALVETLEGRFGQFIGKMRAEIASQVVGRSMEIAEMILRHSLPDRAMIEQLLGQTLDSISDLQGAKIRVHPDDLALLKQNPGEKPPHDGQFEWVADSSLSSGDLIIESRNGIFDASLRQRLERLNDQLRQKMGQFHGTVNEPES